MGSFSNGETGLGIGNLENVGGVTVVVGMYFL